MEESQSVLEALARNRPWEWLQEESFWKVITVMAALVAVGRAMHEYYRMKHRYKDMEKHVRDQEVHFKIEEAAWRSERAGFEAKLAHQMKTLALFQEVGADSAGVPSRNVTAHSSSPWPA